MYRVRFTWYSNTTVLVRYEYRIQNTGTTVLVRIREYCIRRGGVRFAFFTSQFADAAVTDASLIKTS